MKGLISALNDATYASNEDKKTRKSKGWGFFGRRKAKVATEGDDTLPPLVLKAGQTVLDSQSAVAEISITKNMDNSYDEEIMTLAEFMSTQPNIQNRETKYNNSRGHDLSDIVLGSDDGGCNEDNSRENIQSDEFLPSLIPAIWGNSKKIIGSSNTPPPQTVSRFATSNLPTLSVKDGYGSLGRLGFGLLTANNSTARYEGNGSNSKSNSSNTSNSNCSPNSNGSSNCSMEKKSKCKIELVASESHRPVGSNDETFESNNQEINSGNAPPHHSSDSRTSRFHLDYSLKRAVLNAILAATKSEVTVSEQSRISNAYNNYFSTGTVDDDDDDDVINYKDLDSQMQHGVHDNDNINIDIDEHHYSSDGDYEKKYKNDIDDGGNNININEKLLFNNNIKTISHDKINDNNASDEMQKEMNYNFKTNPNPVYMLSEKKNEINENEISFEKVNILSNKIDNDLNSNLEENNLMKRLQISIENVEENNVKTEIKSDSFKEPRPPTPSARPSVAAMSPKRIRIRIGSPRRTQSAEVIDLDLKMESEKVIRRSSEPIPPPNDSKEQKRPNLSFRRCSLVNVKKLEKIDTEKKTGVNNNINESDGSAIKSDDIDINIDNSDLIISNHLVDQTSTKAVSTSIP